MRDWGNEYSNSVLRLFISVASLVKKHGLQGMWA